MSAPLEYGCASHLSDPQEACEYCQINNRLFTAARESRVLFAPATGSEKPLTQGVNEVLRWLFSAEADNMLVEDARKYIDIMWGVEVCAELKAFAAASQNGKHSDTAR